MSNNVVQNLAKLTAIASCLVGITVQADDVVKGIYIVPSVGYHVFDESLSLDDEVSYGIAIGNQLTNNWAVELAYNMSPTKNLAADVDVDYLHLDALYQFKGAETNSAWTPYAVFGVGSVSYDAENAKKIDDTQWNAGLGVKYAINPNLSLRADVRGLLTSDEVEEDTLVNVGVAYAFGKAKPRIVAKPVEPTPAPAPVVAEPAPTPVPVVAEPAASKEVCEMFEGSLEGVVFKVNSADLTDGAKAVLLKTAEILKQNKSVDIDIQAHTDSDGSSEFNKILSLKRSRSVKDFLISQGVDAEKMSTEGFGEEQPVASNATAEGKAQNRRVEIKPHDHTVCGK